MYRSWGKRCFDILASTIGFLCFWPIGVLMAILVRLHFGAPMLFCQQRPGLHGVPFYLYKFRSMSSARNSKGELLPDEDRLTAFGRFLRSTSLDELPELWNVIRGEMSIVGPRPLLMQYLERYSPEQFRRHEVKPGITGWAQVNGRNTLSWEQKFILDVWYTDNLSFWLDLKILVLTAVKIVLREGINQNGQATTQEFMGPKT